MCIRDSYKLALTFASADISGAATSALVKINQYTSSWSSYNPTFNGNTDSASGLTALGSFTLVAPCTLYTPTLSITSNKTDVCIRCV